MFGRRRRAYDETKDTDYVDEHESDIKRRRGDEAQSEEEAEQRRRSQFAYFLAFPSLVTLALQSLVTAPKRALGGLPTEEMLDCVPLHLRERVRAGLLTTMAATAAGTNAEGINSYDVGAWLTYEGMTSIVGPPPTTSAFRFFMGALTKFLDSGVSLETILKVDLHEQTALTNAGLASLLRRLPHLQSLCLAGCKQLTDAAFPLNEKTLFTQLAYLNMNEVTQVSFKTLKAMVDRASASLRTLKVAGLPLQDKQLAELCQSATGLENVKIRLTKATSNVITVLFTTLPALHTLDASFIAFRNMRWATALFPDGRETSLLTKLHLLTSPNKTSPYEVRPNDLANLYKYHPRLRVLSFGPDIRVRASTLASKCPPPLEKLFCSHLPDLGHRACYLVLTQYAHLRFLDLSFATLAAGDLNKVMRYHDAEGGPPLLPHLTSLDLSNTQVSDSDAFLLCRFHTLTHLYLCGTLISDVGLQHICFSCPRLTTLDASGCRSVPLMFRKACLAHFAVKKKALLRHHLDSNSLVNVPLFGDYEVRQIEVAGWSYTILLPVPSNL